MGVSIPDQLLSVDLGTGEIDTEDLPSTWIRHYLGGKGLGARYLYNAVDHTVDPLDADNVLILMVGPLTGYLPDDGRFAAITKSPLTGLFLDSYAGGSFGISLRASNPELAGICLRGASADTYVLDARTDPPTLSRTPELAGEPVDVVDATYPEAAVLATGPAGEHGVAYATIATDGGDHHAGRGGAGAVMGSKGLKAIVLPKQTSIDAPNDRIASLRSRAREAFSASPYGTSYRSAGTLESVTFADAHGILPTHGWRERTFDGASDIGLEAAAAAAEGRERTDGTFPGDFRVDVDDYETVIRGGTPIALGAGLGVEDFDAVSMLGATCDRLGIDVISAGNAVALAIIASEAGRIDRELTWGDADAARDVLSEIATQSSELGSLLAHGVEEAARALELEGVIPTVKAMAVPSFDPRGVPAMALAYATSDRGACHRRAVPATVNAFEEGWTPTQIASAVVGEQNRRALLWCLIVDDVTAPMVPDLGQSWLAALGMELSREDLKHIGERTWTLTRLFNVREGVDREADALPEIFQRSDSGDTDGIDATFFGQTLDRYYEQRDWDPAGRPSQRLLARLDLEDVRDEATPVGAHPLHGHPERQITRTDAGE